MYLSQMVKMNEKELNKKSKTDIVKAITGYSYQYTHMETQVKDMQKKLDEQKVNENAAKKLLIAYTGYVLEKPEYGEPTIDSVDLLHLVGLALEKAARY